MSARSNGSVRRLNSFGTRKSDKRLGPDAHGAGLPLFGEHQLPIIVPQSDDLLVVVAVDERDPRALLRFTGQIWHQIMAVEVGIRAQMGPKPRHSL
jgi:hypothetical protein